MMSNSLGTQTVDGILHSICGSNVGSTSCLCGSCEYELQNGMYQRVGAGSCTGSCTCPASITPLAVSLLEAVCPSVQVTGETVILCCGAPSLAETEGGKLTELLKALLAGYKLWRLVSLGLGILALVLAGVVVYLLMRG